MGQAAGLIPSPTFFRYQTLGKRKCGGYGLGFRGSGFKGLGVPGLGLYRAYYVGLRYVYIGMEKNLETIICGRRLRAQVTKYRLCCIGVF